MRRDGFRVPRTLTATIVERDDNQCQKCGAEKKLGIHHVVSLREGGTNDPDNLVTLCRSCHMTLHHKQGDMPKWDRDGGGRFRRTDAKFRACITAGYACGKLP